MKHVLAISAMCLLAACGSGNFGQKLNPLNWFSGGGARTVDGAPSLAPRRGYPSATETRALAANISQARTERTAGGLIVKVEVAIAGTGFRGVDLVRRRDTSPGVLVLEARVSGQATPAVTSVTAATFLSDQDLARITEIQIISAASTAQLRP